MGELLECGLDGCGREQLALLVEAVMAQTTGRVVVEFHEGSSTDECRNVKEAIARLLAEPGLSCDLRLEQLSIGGRAAIRDVVMQIFPVAPGYDLLMNFREENTDGFEQCLRALHGWLSALKATYRLASVYCGLDPADDESTRFFTDGRLGPLRA